MIFSLISFSWVSGGTSYKLLVLSAKTSRFGDFFIFLTSFFNVFWNGSVTLRNFILLVISNMSFSNWSSLLQRGGHLRVLKPKWSLGEFSASSMVSLLMSR